MLGWCDLVQYTLKISQDVASTGSLGNLFQDLPTLVVKNLAWLGFPLLQLLAFVSCPPSVHFWEGSGFLFNSQPH